MVGPANMPRDIVLKLNAAMDRVLKSPTFLQRFGSIGDEPGGGPLGAVRRHHPHRSGKMEGVQRSGAKLE